MIAQSEAQKDRQHDYEPSAAYKAGVDAADAVNDTGNNRPYRLPGAVGDAVGRHDASPEFLWRFADQQALKSRKTNPRRRAD